MVIFLVKECFYEIIKEARNGEVHIWDYDDNELVEFIYRTQFKTVFNNRALNDNDNNILTIYINNEKKTILLLEKYVILVSRFYNIDVNRNTVKKIITLLFSNITKEDTKNINLFIIKYISFLMDNTMINYNIDKDINYNNIGCLHGNVKLQSLKQETPYAFYSYFDNIINGLHVHYQLPKISFGIQNDICYIYAIQNQKQLIDNRPEQVQYNTLVKDTIRTLNHSIKKYRNVTPSFVTALTFFLATLQKQGIDKYKVVSGLPIRMHNRKLVNDYKLKVQTKKGILSQSDIVNLRKSLEDERFRIDYNATDKFKNIFHRISIHFEQAINFLDVADNYLDFKLDELLTNNTFLQEIVSNNKSKGR